MKFKHLSEWLTYHLDNIGMWKFDKKHGTDTAGYFPWEALTRQNPVGPEKGHGYQGASAWIIERSLRSLPINHADYTLIDLGSGKGRVLLLASHLPFKKIIGLELFEVLHRVAEKNISVYESPRKQCHDLASCCTHVLDFAIPPVPLVFFLFNPFRREVIEAWLAKIGQSLLVSPRPIWIIYQNPVFNAAFGEANFLQLRKKLTLPLLSQWSYVIYGTQRHLFD